MSKSLGRRAATAATVIALGGLGVVAAQAPASASTFTGSYTCNSILGTQNITVNGTATASPNPTTVGTSTHFTAHIATSLSSPLAINSWSATLTANVSGAQTASFQATGSGGSIPANQAIAADVAGDWTPTAAGTDQISGGNVSIKANVVLVGNITATCTPNSPIPVAETLTVN
ncbi:hypothetical protein GCM10023196_100180 [Actinoallomurus vinaceus]|uniref:Uncharacterized protein n=1 Tax=Actinoallomurus vinaceus TaxID=1080074 RepID=A0ABP8UT29_9ACTN